jgi:NADPH2:quinone reductase
MKAIVVHKPGGPEAMVYSERDLPSPGPGQARVRLHVVGVNYIDVYHRTGAYALPLPFTPGSEGAGVVEAVGPGVTDVKPGDRVAYAGEPGAYAQSANVAAWRLVAIPDGLAFDQAAASMLQGMTARYLVHQTYPIHRGDTVLIHAAAGGVGLWLTQMAHEAGARVLATVGSEEKGQLARGAGADHIIYYRTQSFVDEVKRITDGARCHVVYDAVGKDTFSGSLDSLRPRGTMVLYGASSGPVPSVETPALARASLFFTRPTLHNYASNRAEVLGLATPVLEGLRAGRYSLRIDRTLPLSQAPEAHRLLEGRATAGKLILDARA